MTGREAFKFGFLARCIEDGITDPAHVLATVKSASDKLAGFLEKLAFDIPGLAPAVEAVKYLGDKAVNVGLPTALAAPPLLGAVGGGALAKATDIDDSDVDDVKDREIVNAYRTEAAKLKRQDAVRDYAKARARTGRIFL